MIHLIVFMALLALTHIFCFAAMTERKYSVRKTVLIYGAFGIFFIVWVLLIYALLGSNSPYVAPAAFSCTIIVAFFVFVRTSSDAFCKKLFLFVSYGNLFCIFYCIASLLCGVLFPALSGIELLDARNIVRTLLYVPAVAVYLRFLRPYMCTVPGGQKRTWYSISLVSVLFLTAFGLFMFIFYLPAAHTDPYISLFLALTLLYGAVLWVVFEAVRSIHGESRRKLAAKNVEYLQGQLALERENELAVKTIRHDFRHHNQNISILLQKGDVEGALCYIEQYNNRLDAVRTREFCPHITVNAILNNFFLRACKEGISVSAAADTPRQSGIADMDFVAILSNLLENALNGCKECGSHEEIRVNLRTVAEKTVIVCSNPCKPGLAIENGMLKEKGTGIESILLAVRKYGGDIRYKMEDGCLTVCVILNA